MTYFMKRFVIHGAVMYEYIFSVTPEYSVMVQVSGQMPLR